MARGEYYVWGEGGRWHVRHNGLTISFETPRVALGAALGEANKAGALGAMLAVCWCRRLTANGRPSGLTARIRPRNRALRLRRQLSPL